MSARYTGHGSMAAHKRHLAAGEPDCDQCAAYMAAWRDVHGWGPLDLRPCGTPAALRRHERRREPIDEACRKTRVRIHEDYELVRGPRDRSAERRRAANRGGCRMTPLPYAPTVPELAAANAEARRTRPRRTLRRVVVADARRRRPC